MTDSQAINSSDCAWMCDKLEDTQRKLGTITYKSHGSEISYLKLQAVLASHDLIYRLSQLQERLSKLEDSRALVAEQEQASECANSQLCPKCRGCGETAPWNSECSFQCEKCKGEGVVKIAGQEQASAGETQFSVGDTVCLSSYKHDLRVIGSKKEAEFTAWNFLDGGWDYEYNLTLIKKAGE